MVTRKTVTYMEIRKKGKRS